MADIYQLSIALSLGVLHSEIEGMRLLLHIVVVGTYDMVVVIVMIRVC